MGVDVIATAKVFEEHAKDGHLPELLARELNNLSDADRLAVAKQVRWDMQQQQQQDPKLNLPKLEFYDTGSLKSIERTGKYSNGTLTETDQKTLDASGYVKSEIVKTVVEDPSRNEFSTRLEIKERNANGKYTRTFETSARLMGNYMQVNTEEDFYAYDAKTGKQISHDEVTSWGRKVHEEFDPTTGKDKIAIIEEPNSKKVRTYDKTSGKLQQEEIVYADKSQETIKYDSNGDKVYSEKRWGNNGDKGTRSWNYSPRTGKMTYSEFREPSGKVTMKHNIDENGKWTPIKD